MGTRLYKVTFPDGHVENVVSLLKFCKENNLNSQQAHRVVSGKSAHHKGYLFSLLDANENSPLDIKKRTRISKLVEACDELLKIPYSKLTLDQKLKFIITIYALEKIYGNFVK